MSFSSPWGRFSKYELDGRFVRPARDAKWEPYDPWKDFREAQGRKAVYRLLTESLELPSLVRLEESPYGVFDKTDVLAYPDSVIDKRYRVGVEGLRFVERGGCAIHWKSEKDLLAFFKKYGLLGIPLASIRKLVLAPRWDMSTGASTRPTQISFSRHARGWMSDEELADTRAAEATFREAGELVPKAQIPDGWPAPHAEFRCPGASEWTRAPLREVWGQFFPEIEPRDKETADYPEPLTREFWQSYAEPLDLIVNELAALRHISLALQSLKLDDVEVDDSPDSAALGALNSLLESSSPQIDVDEEGVTRTIWACPSLLTSLAVMVFHQLTDKFGRLKECDCGKLFEATAFHKVYCSHECYKRVNKRKERAKGRASSRPGNHTKG